MSKPITTLVPWYGSNRMLASRVGELLAGCAWVGIPFAGGMSEIAHIRARTIVANDLHRGVISLACWVRNHCDEAVEYLSQQVFHPDTLAEAQKILTHNVAKIDTHVALAYFVTCWMTRSGTAGTDGETTGKLALRWEAAGGDSAKRYHSAIAALPKWAEEFQRCTFSTLDCFAFLDKCKDRAGHGIYCDPPFPGPGDKYTHKFTEDSHRRLAERLAAFNQARVVCRFYDHPFIRELYPESRWKWIHQEGRTQANKAAPEVLIINEPVAR